jgi:hypothetical protein
LFLDQANKLLREQVLQTMKRDQNAINVCPACLSRLAIIRRMSQNATAIFFYTRLLSEVI